MAEPKIVSTGISSLDHLLRGGIPARQTVVVTGEPGTGKTVLCSQIAFAFAKQGRRVVVATVASESHDKLLEELGGFTFFEREQVGDNLFVLSIYPWLKKGAKDAKDLLLKTMRERKADLLFVDGLRSLRDLWQNEAQLRDFLYEISVGIAQLGAVALLTTEYAIEKLMEYPEATTVDGIIALSTRLVNGHVVRRARVVKLRGRHHLQGEHVLHITDGGIEVVPRLEETVSPAPGFTPAVERAAFGLPELDKILDGGLPRKSTTLLAGSTGVGKTLLALHLASHAAQTGERALMVSYSEPIERLVARAKNVSIDVRDVLERKQLLIDYRMPLDAEGDDLIAELLARVRETDAKLVVIDGIGDLEDVIYDRGRVRALLTALIVELRNLGVTSVFIREVAQIAAPSLDFSDTPISVTAENLLFCRHVELRGRLHRILSVLKMRESGFDPQVREFVVANDGIRVLDRVDSAEGLLTGAARMIPPPQERSR
jgi:circadian clock protein KaiC